MSLLELLSGSSGIEAAVIAHPLEFGYRPGGLPRIWKRTPPALLAGQPAEMWLDSSAVAADELSDPDEERDFVSSAIVMAWTISGMSDSPARLANLVGEVTEAALGWSARGRSGESLPGQGFSLHMRGTLDSPFGPLISNVHNVVCPIGGGESIIVQLAVTATQEWSVSADAALLERAGPGSH